MIITLQHKFFFPGLQQYKPVQRPVTLKNKREHTIAMALFQPYTATGKLNAEMMPTTPRGFQFSKRTCPGLSEGNN
jgi:hypothetical protein